MNIRKNDTIKMLSGKDRYKSGKVLSVLNKGSKVVIEGLNLFKKAIKPKKQGQKGQIISKPRAVDISKVMLICPKCGKSTRVGFVFEKEKKIRLCKKCGATGI